MGLMDYKRSFDQDYGGKLLDPGNLFDSHEKLDLSGVKQAQDRAFGTQDKLADERANFGGLFNPEQDSSLHAGQIQNITDLAKIAAGKVPSPVELQLREQAARNAAGAYGQAAALQGGNPGAALRMALDSAFRTNADANIQAGIARAAEQQRAQMALTDALFRTRNQEQNLLGADTDWRKALLSGELGALGAGTGAAKSAADAQAASVAADNQKSGSILGGLGAILSDERTKEDVKPADLDTLADSLKGFRFRYKNGSGGPAGERVGVMAQDAAKGGPAGKRMVNLGNDGHLRLDVGNAVGAALAMSAKALRETRKGA
jgi:hypothetical protein